MNKIVPIIDSEDWYDMYHSEEAYREYVDECKDFDREASPMDSDGYLNWCIDTCNTDIDCDLDNVDLHSDNHNSMFVISGKLGLWDGTHTIMPVKVIGLRKAIRKCCGECGTFKATLDEKRGVICVEASHHDGTNCFEIQKVRRDCTNVVSEASENVWPCVDFDTIELKHGWFRKIRNPWAA